MILSKARHILEIEKRYLTEDHNQYAPDYTKEELVKALDIAISAINKIESS